MSEAKSYTIDKVGWHTKTPGNTEPRETTFARFKVIINFLQDNGFTTRIVLPKDAVIDDETCIHTEFLTDAGRAIMKQCYSKWLRKVDRGMDPEDISIFEKAANNL